MTTEIPPPPPFPSSSHQTTTPREESSLEKRMKSASKILGKDADITQEQLKEETVRQWKRFDGPVAFNKSRLHVDTSALPENTSETDKQAVIDQCREAYRQASDLHELDIGNAALSYVSGRTAQKGPLLQLTNTSSQRYLDLYEAYVHYEMSKGLPMITSAAGHLKAEGLTTQDILSLQIPAQRLTTLLTGLKAPFSERAEKTLLELTTMATLSPEKQQDFRKMVRDTKSRQVFLKKLKDQKLEGNEARLYEIAKKYDAIMNLYNDAVLSIFSFQEKRSSFLENQELQELTPLLQEAYKAFDILPSKPQICKLFNKLDRHGNSVDEIEQKFSELADVKTASSATAEERVLMEMRYRLCEESTGVPTETGSLGQNPLAYFNIVTQGEPGNPQAEFRNQMTFVYKNRLFANEIIENPEFVDFANPYLKEEQKGWQIDKTFTTIVSKSDPSQVVPPIFRQGVYAKLDSALRTRSDPVEVARFYAEHPRPTYKALHKKTTPSSALFQYELSAREMLALTGELRAEDMQQEQPVPYLSGSTTYHLRTPKELAPLKDTGKGAALEYLAMVKELELPTAGGISGTFDATMIMSGLVGLGVGETKKAAQERELVRLACVAYFAPARHHSVHEVMQSSQSFGMEYTPGPGFERQLYPSNPEEFLTRLSASKRQSGHKDPSLFLSKEYALETFHRMKTIQ